MRSLIFCLLFGVSAFGASSQDLKIAEKIEGRWANKTTGNSNSFSLKDIKADNGVFTATLTLWASNNCGIRDQKVTGVIKDGIATFNVDSRCTPDYVATLDFLKKSGSYRAGEYQGTYEFK